MIRYKGSWGTTFETYVQGHFEQIYGTVQYILERDTRSFLCGQHFQCSATCLLERYTRWLNLHVPMVQPLLTTNLAKELGHHHFPRFPMVFPWFSYDFPRFTMVFPWVSHAFLTDPLTSTGRA